MNETLRTRIADAVFQNTTPKVAKTIMNQVDKDLVLPLLKLNSRTKVNARTDKKYTYLYVGPRDWQFYKSSGRLIGCGTALSA